MEPVREPSDSGCERDVPCSEEGGEQRSLETGGDQSTDGDALSPNYLLQLRLRTGDIAYAQHGRAYRISDDFGEQFTEHFRKRVVEILDPGPGGFDEERWGHQFKAERLGDWPTQEPDDYEPDSRIIAKRIKQGCPNCGQPWESIDLEQNRPASGSSCDACYNGQSDDSGVERPQTSTGSDD